MRHTVAAFALLSALALPVAASDFGSGTELPVKELPTVECWSGSEQFEMPAEKVSAQNGGLFITFKGTTQITTYPCIARIPTDTQLPTDENARKVECMDHTGTLIYVGEALQFGISAGVMWWFETAPEAGELGYRLVLATALCRVG